MAEPRTQRLLAWLAAGGLAAALAVAGYWLLFTAFMLYDDEGYILLSLKNFSAHGALYDRVYSQYGPWPFLFHDALHRLTGLAFDNTTGRWITWVNWLGTASACSLLVARVTRSAVWTAFTFAGVFTYLWVMINEPVHPGGLICLVVALAGWLGAVLWSGGHHARFAALAGFAAATLALTKINVGAFFFGAAFTWLAVNTTPPAWSRRLVWLIAIGCASLPFVLMRSLFDASWVRLYALIFSAAALALLLAVRRTGRAVAGLRVWLWFFATLAGTGAVLCVLAVTRGSSWTALVNGIVLEPLRHPGVYFFAMHWRPGAGVLALVSAGLAAWIALKGRWDDPRIREAIAWLRLLAAGVFLCAPLQIIPTSPPGWGMSYGISLAWLFAVPLGGGGRAAVARGWIALLLVFQFLHAYPIAGSQMNWGTFLWVPLLALGLHEAAPLLGARLARWRAWPARLGFAVILITTAVMAGNLLHLGGTRYFTSEPLRLRGAENLRMPHEITYALRIVDENLRAHGDMLFSAPGLYSANLWSGLPTPTLANVTHWFTLLSRAQQQAIVDRLAASPRPLLLVQRGLLDYLVKNGFAVGGPLQSWLRENFTPAFSIYPYEIWVRRGRTIAALSTARPLPPDAAGRPGLALVLQAPRVPVARVEVCDVTAPRTPLFTLDGANASATTQPLALDGSLQGTPEPAPFPFATHGLVQIVLRYAPGDSAEVGPRTLLVLRAADDTVLAELRLLAG